MSCFHDIPLSEDRQRQLSRQTHIAKARHQTGEISLVIAHICSIEVCQTMTKRFNSIFSIAFDKSAIDPVLEPPDPLPLG